MQRELVPRKERQDVQIMVDGEIKKQRKKKEKECVCEPALSHQDIIVAAPFPLPPSSLLRFPKGHDRTTLERLRTTLRTTLMTCLVVLLLGFEGA